MEWQLVRIPVGPEHHDKGRTNLCSGSENVVLEAYKTARDSGDAHDGLALVVCDHDGHTVYACS